MNGHRRVTIKRVAETLGADEDWLFELSISMFPEHGCLWAVGVGEEAITALFHDLEAWRRYASAAGFEPTHYCRPEGAPREQQPWLASVWRRLAP